MEGVGPGGKGEGGVKKLEGSGMVPLGGGHLRKACQGRCFSRCEAPGPLKEVLGVFWGFAE